MPEQTIPHRQETVNLQIKSDWLSRVAPILHHYDESTFEGAVSQSTRKGNVEQTSECNTYRPLAIVAGIGSFIALFVP